MLKSLFFSATAKDTSALFGSSMISNLLGLVILAILPRTLNQSDLGLFLTALVFCQLIADLFELGINSASLNFISSPLETERYKLMKVGLTIKLITGFLIILICYIFSSFISQIIFGNQEMKTYIKISAVGALFLMLIAWAQTILQAQKHFIWSGLINASTNIFRFLVLAFLILLGFKSSLDYYFYFQVILILSFLLFFIPIGFKFMKAKTNLKNYLQLINFGLPVGFGFALAAIYTRLDQIFVLNLAGSAEAATYGLASRLTLVIIFAFIAFNSAIIPRFVSLEQKEFNSYFKKTLSIIGLIGLSLIFGIAMAPFFIPLLFSSNFNTAVLPFQILAVGILFFIISAPFNNAILYRYKQNRFPFALATISLLLILILLNVLVPIYKSTGAALAMSIVYLVQLIITFVFYLKIKNA